jgi:thioredoxin reductase (NADPH)
LVQTQNQLTGLEILNTQGDTEVIPADAMLLCLGVSPKLGPISDWGLALERKQLPVNTETNATESRGIFAVGDINTYPGKKKLILCGFHEATLAAFGASALLRPDQKTLLQYTTTSTHLHKLLGVS